MTLPEVVFPRNPGPIGSEVPSRAAPGLADFDQSEFCGWATGSFQGRLTFCADPAGSSHTCTRWEVRYGDIATDRYGPDGQRIELWREDSAQSEGDEAWFAWAWFLGDGTKGDLFRFPSSWALMFQHHGVAEGGPPVYGLEITPNGWVSNPRKTGSDEAGRKIVGPATLGRWHHFVQHVKFSTDPAKGLMELWHGVDGWPALGSGPVDRRTQNTLISKPTRTTLHMYRDHNQPASEYPWTAINGGFARAASAARAQQLAWPTTVTPPAPTNAQLRDQAVAELHLTTRGLKGYTPPPGSHWKTALDLLARIS